jgi:dihydroflavonol-4-reductase
LVAKGYSVRAIRRSDKIPGFVEASYFNNVEWLTGNVLDTDILENAMKGIDAVIHAAALVSFETREEKSMYQTNVEGTANMVNAALMCQVPRFVYISSVASLGRKNDGKLVSESSEWEDSKLNTHYAKSKYLCRNGSMEGYWRRVECGNCQSQYHIGLWRLE